ncbi:hypothetical protein D3C73_1520410 [compost metagenome]
MSGRRPREISKAFKVLAAENYIEWSTFQPVEAAVLLEVWERNVSYDTTPQADTQSARQDSRIDYWLYH